MGFFSKRRNKIIEKEIRNAYLLKGKLHDTNIYWQAFERFAQEYGGMTDRYADGGQDTAFEMTIHDDDIFDGVPKEFFDLLYKEPGTTDEPPKGTKVKVMAVRDRLDGTASIQVENLEDYKQRVLSEKIRRKLQKR